MSQPVFYGKDLALTSGGFVGTFPMATGARLVVQGLYRRWTTSERSRAGQRIYKGRCKDLRELLAAQVTQAKLMAFAREMQEVALEDERVDDCVVLFSYRDSTLTVRAQGRGSQGPFAFLIPFDTFTPELLLEAA